MKDHWRKLLSLMPATIERKAFRNFYKGEHRKLQTNNHLGIASNLSKQDTLLQLQDKFRLNILVETGTYLGDTLFALQPYFKNLYSIELSEHFFEKAKQRFRKYKNINLINGDSGKELKKLLITLNEPALFWLDGHYSGGLTARGEKECPVFEELEAILSDTMQHVIVIDDARLFIGKNDYPTIEKLKIFVSKFRPAYHMAVYNDSIRLFPGDEA